MPLSIFILKNSNGLKKMFDHTPNQEARFNKIPQNDDCETLLSQSSTDDYTKKPKRPLWHYGISSLFLLYSVIIFLAGIWIGSHRLFDADSFCGGHVSHYSPLVKERIGLHYNLQRFNGSFMKLNAFRQPAGPEVDAAWGSLGTDYRAFVVSPSDGPRSGLTPKTHVHISPQYGGGYPANVEGLHHLHCLNLLRQALYYNYDYYHALGQGAFSNADHVVRFHVTHCLDILRQQLMCAVDVGVLGQVWTFREDPSAFVDFNTEHKCRNYDAVRKWAEKRQLPEEVPPDFLVPLGAEDVVYEEIP
ncbi:hypothetical protein VE01_05884 [Pseudogymnoascus verrucosus]|uniref:Tat pathway signal sequence n=1 Tax=Pseudogymnoascus verrucosus TaxID=342668 RepID=A0A1B8GIM6_9PEZI|nr:uncharacterized protein VE01_05884 [Pseudogymnoascus verrucosus]OBT95655.1 hypothetical protein VE01_05884 [Pseudogymnoascus verrucosus]